MNRRSAAKHSIALGLGSLVLAVANTAHAQLALPSGLADLIPDRFENISTAVGLVWNTVVGISGVAFLGLLLYGGFLYLTSAGNDQVADRAKHTIRDGLIGIVLVILAWPIGIAVLSFFGVTEFVTTDPTSGLELPTGTSTTPIEPFTSGAAPSTSGGSTPTTSGNTSTTTTPSGQQQKKATVPNAKANSTFVVKQPGQPTQVVKADETGNVSYTLDPSFTYTPTEVIILKNKLGVGEPVPGTRIRIYNQQDVADDQPLYEFNVGDTGKITLDLPVGEKVRIVDATTGTELLRDQVISPSIGNQIQAFIPSN